MPSSSASSTASDDGSQPEPEQHAEAVVIAKRQQTAVVTWRDSEGNGHSSPTAHIDLEYDSGKKTALFRLCFTVLVSKHDTRKLFLVVVPERIQSLVIVGADTDYGADHQDNLEVGEDQDATVRKILGAANARTCLRFSLRRPCDLIAPKRSSVTPKTEAHGRLLDSVRALAEQTAFDIHIRTRSLSRVQHASLARAALSISGLTSSLGLGDIGSLNAGAGGVVVNNPAPTGQSHHAGDGPPSYDEAGAGPPMPPVSGPTGAGLSKKRRRDSSDGITAKTEHDAGTVCELMAELRTAVQELRASRTELRQTKQELKLSMQSNQELKTAVHRLKNDLSEHDDEISQLRSRVQDLEEASEDWVESNTVDDLMDNFKEDLRELLTEEIVPDILSNGRWSFDTS